MNKRFYSAIEAAERLKIDPRYFRQLVQDLNIKPDPFHVNAAGQSSKLSRKHIFTFEQIEYVRMKMRDKRKTGPKGKRNREVQIVYTTADTIKIRVPIELPPKKETAEFIKLCLHCPHPCHGEVGLSRCCQCDEFVREDGFSMPSSLRLIG
jgi:hypothetical protein